MEELVSLSATAARFQARAFCYSARYADVDGSAHGIDKTPAPRARHLGAVRTQRTPRGGEHVVQHRAERPACAPSSLPTSSSESGKDAVAELTLSLRRLSPKLSLTESALSEHGLALSEAREEEGLLRVRALKLEVREARAEAALNDQVDAHTDPEAQHLSAKMRLSSLSASFAEESGALAALALVLEGKLATAEAQGAVARAPSSELGDALARARFEVEKASREGNARRVLLSPVVLYRILSLKTASVRRRIERREYIIVLALRFHSSTAETPPQVGLLRPSNAGRYVPVRTEERRTPESTSKAAYVPTKTEIGNRDLHRAVTSPNDAPGLGGCQRGNRGQALQRRTCPHRSVFGQSTSHELTVEIAPQVGLIRPSHARKHTKYAASGAVHQSRSVVEMSATQCSVGYTPLFRGVPAMQRQAGEENAGRSEEVEGHDAAAGSDPHSLRTRHPIESKSESSQKVKAQRPHSARVFARAKGTIRNWCKADILSGGGKEEVRAISTAPRARRGAGSSSETPCPIGYNGVGRRDAEVPEMNRAFTARYSPLAQAVISHHTHSPQTQKKRGTEQKLTILVATAIQLIWACAIRIHKEALVDLEKSGRLGRRRTCDERQWDNSEGWGGRKAETRGFATESDGIWGTRRGCEVVHERMDSEVAPKGTLGPAQQKLVDLSAADGVDWDGKNGAFSAPGDTALDHCRMLLRRIASDTSGRVSRDGRHKVTGPTKQRKGQAWISGPGVVVIWCRGVNEWDVEGET
ncbi:hypothetical protein DFH09DRAFT_1285477 [Mycena vulgaris]|nr:hypothetical protein DFH09DRAFT_1285477 [Mycena vulgaris]